MAAIYPNVNVEGLTYEEETTFGTDPASAPTRLWVGNIKAELTPTMIPDPTQQSSGLAGDRPRIRGPRGGKLTFEQPIYAIAGSEAPLISLAKRCGCTHIAVAASGANKITGGSATTFVCLDADIGNIAVGCGIVHIPDTGTPSMRFVTRIQADTPGAGSKTVTVDSAFATTPANSDAWAATDTLIPATGVQAKSFAFNDYKGGTVSNCVKKPMAGCVGKYKLNTAKAGALLQAAWEWMVDNYTGPTAATLAMAAKAAGSATPLCALGCTVKVADTAIAIQSLDFDPGLAVQWDDSHAGAHGHQGAFYGKANPTIAFSPLMDTAWWDKVDAGTAFEFLYTRVVDATNGFGFYLPAVEVEGMADADDGALVRAAPKLHVIDPGLNADSAQLPQWAICMTH